MWRFVLANVLFHCFISIIFKGVLKRSYYQCCRDGEYRDCAKNRATSTKRKLHKPSRKLGVHCISRMTVDEMEDGTVLVKYISAHTGHDVGEEDLPYLPLPPSTKEEISMKLIKGVTCERIIDGKSRIMS